MFRNLRALEEASQEVDNTAQETGLIIDQEKEKFISVRRTHNHCRQIAVGGNRYGRVSSFPYLGSIINGDNSISDEITYRIKKGNRVCVHL
jgi:hypothetical protein